MKKSFDAKTLIYPTPVWLIGTYDKNGKPNIATIAWGGVCSSDTSVHGRIAKSCYLYSR